MKALRRSMLLLAAALLLLPLVVEGQTTTISFTYTWTAPATGSPVHHYEVQSSADNGTLWSDRGTTPTNSVTLNLAVGQTHVVRVRAVDGQGRSGPWSVQSDPNTPDAGPPGACGKPGLLK